MIDITIEKIRKNPGKELFDKLVMFTIDAADEVAMVPVVPDDCVRQFYTAISQGMTWVARGAAGELLGIVVMTEANYWYNLSASFLVDLVFYIAPAGRGSMAAELLCDAVRNEALRRRVHAIVRVANPSKPARMRLIPLC